MQHTAAIEIRALKVVYEAREIIGGFNLTVHRGEKVILDGPSGCGKSTVLKCVLGLAVPQQGEIRIWGRVIDRHTVWSLRQQVAYVPQEPDLGGGTVRQVIERPFHYRGNVRLRTRLERVPHLLEAYRLPKLLLDKRAATLSGGERQRVALVVARLLDRPVMILDEATAALDQAHKQAVAAAMVADAPLTVLAVSHDRVWHALPTRCVTMGLPQREDVRA